MTFYGTIERAEVVDQTAVLRCVREYFEGDGLMSDDVWLWTVADIRDGAGISALLGRAVCGFEAAQHSLKVWLDEGDDAVVITGSAVTKVEEARSRADLERVVMNLSSRIQRDQTDYRVLLNRVRAIATSIYQKIDRLERRAAFESERRGESPKDVCREIEDLLGIVRRLEEPNKPVETTRGTQP